METDRYTQNWTSQPVRSKFRKKHVSKYMVGSSRGRHVMLISDLQMCIHMHTLFKHTYITYKNINRTKELAQWIRHLL